MFWSLGATTFCYILVWCQFSPLVSHFWECKRCILNNFLQVHHHMLDRSSMGVSCFFGWTSPFCRFMVDTVARSAVLADPASGRLSPLFSSRGTRWGIGFTLLSRFYESCLFADLSTSLTACYDHPESAERQDPTWGSDPPLCLFLWNLCLQQRTENVHTLDPVHMLFSSFGLELFFLVGLFLFVPIKSPVVHASVLPGLWQHLPIHKACSMTFLQLFYPCDTKADCEPNLYTKQVTDLSNAHEGESLQTDSKICRKSWNWERGGCFLSWWMAMVFPTQC